MIRQRAEGYPPAQTNLPTSAVGAIGGGFISFALCVVLALTLYRMFRTWQDVKRRRRAGENITFSAEWARTGGFWGFISNFSGNSALAVGPVGRMDEWRWRMMEMAREREDELRKPEMWEIEVKKNVTKDRITDGLGLNLGEVLRPMAVDSHGKEMPMLGMSILILMPSMGGKPDDSEEDLPDMLIGTTEIIPTIGANGSTESIDKAELGKMDGRRATWKISEKRTVEGL